MSEIQLHHADCLTILPQLDPTTIAAIVTDPPYGIAYQSNQARSVAKRKKEQQRRSLAKTQQAQDHYDHLANEVANDKTTEVRDAVVRWGRQHNIPMLLFGSWKARRPKGTRLILIWDKGEGVGMGDLDTPWKPVTEEIYVIGRGFQGKRSSNIIRVYCTAQYATKGEPRLHPTHKPVVLMRRLVEKCPAGGFILDPFMGVGGTGIACKRLGRDFIGIELDDHNFEIAQRRIAGVHTERQGLGLP